MLGGLTGRTQKQGSAEADSGGRKRQVFALFLDYIIAQLFNICQLYKKMKDSNTLNRVPSFCNAARIPPVPARTRL
jgi:hypothetical protein